MPFLRFLHREKENQTHDDSYGEVIPGAAGRFVGGDDRMMMASYINLGRIARMVEQRSLSLRDTLY